MKPAGSHVRKLICSLQIVVLSYFQLYQLPPHRNFTCSTFLLSCLESTTNSNPCSSFLFIFPLSLFISLPVRLYSMTSCPSLFTAIALGSTQQLHRAGFRGGPGSEARLRGGPGSSFPARPPGGRASPGRASTVRHDDRSYV